MGPRISSRIGAIAIVGVVVSVGVGLLLVLLGRGPGEPAPIITPAVPTPADNPVVARINDSAINYSFWMEMVVLDQVMSGLAGQPAPTPEETLQRLVNEELVMEAFPPEQAPTTEGIEAQIAALEQTWGVNDAAVVAALESTGLTRTAFERAVERLLVVQMGLEALRSQGDDSISWLEQQRADAEIWVMEGIAALAIPTIQSPLPTLPMSPLPTITTEAPPPTPGLAISAVAPDFTLERAGGGELTLKEQLAQGAVVLVFFQKCG